MNEPAAVSTYLLPIVFGLFVWWFSTGLALWVVGLSARAPRTVLCGTAVAMGLALAAITLTRSDGSETGAYVAFTAAIVVWGAQEVAFLAGWVTGPWRAPCPPGATGWARTGFAVRAILYHEIGLVLSGLAVLAPTWDGANRIGAATFGILLAMRVSAKLNIFLGVPNITDSFMPAKLDHLKSFFARRPMNGLFPVSVTVATAALVLLVAEAWSAEGASATAVTLLATLVALGLAEHWFLVLPLPVEALWTWSGATARLPVETAARPPAAALAGSAAGPGATVLKLERRPARQNSYRAQSPGRIVHPRPVGDAQVAPVRSE